MTVADGSEVGPNSKPKTITHQHTTYSTFRLFPHAPARFLLTKWAMYLLFDTETTGAPVRGAAPADPAQPFIMQLGAILATADFEPQIELEMLIQLPPGTAIHPKALAAHGIRYEDCQKLGVEPSTAYQLFTALAKCAKVVVCHNYAFDSQLWATHCARLKAVNVLENMPRVCTMTEMTPVMQLPGSYGYKWPKLQEAYAYCNGGQTFSGAHNALSDVRAALSVLKWLKTEPNRPAPAPAPAGPPPQPNPKPQIRLILPNGKCISAL